MKKGILFVVSGPSGSGKGTILGKICSLNSNIAVSVSATTRKPRVGEVYGEDYYFLEEDVFLKHVETGEMLEYNKYCGNYYGTLKSEVERLLSCNEVVILEVDVNGAENIGRVYECVKVFVLPPSLEVLKSRLEKRKTENLDSLKNRLTQACVEVETAFKFDYLIINDDADEASRQLLSIVEANQRTVSRMNSFLEEFLVSGLSEV